MVEIEPGSSKVAAKCADQTADTMELIIIGSFSQIIILCLLPMTTQ